MMSEKKAKTSLLQACPHKGIALRMLLTGLALAQLFCAPQKLYAQDTVPALSPPPAQVAEREQLVDIEGGQVKEVKDTSRHSPRRAALYSALLPGLGQIYNGRYWKLPLVYGGGVAFAYFIQTNSFRKQIYAQAYDARYRLQEIETKLANLDPKAPDYETTKTGLESDKAATEASIADNFKRWPMDRLQYYRNKYRRDMQFFIILTVLFYGVQIIDAAVDAHFFTYDISNDLSFRITPYVDATHASTFGNGLKANPNVGLNLTLNF